MITISTKSVFVRIFSVTSMILAGIIVALSIVSYTIIDRVYFDGLKRSLSAASEIVVEAVNEGFPMNELSKICASYARNSHIRTTIVSSDGAVILETDCDETKMSNHSRRLEISKALAGEKYFTIRHSSTLNTDMIYIAVPAGKTKNGLYEYCVRQSVPLKRIGEVRAMLAREISIFSLVGFALSTILSYFLARKISKPLRELTKATSQMANGDFDTPIKTSNISEIQRLGTAITKMADNLKKRLNSLHKRNCELDEIFEHMRECVFICSRKGKLRNYNKSFARLFSLNENFEKLDTAEAVRNNDILEAVDEVFENGNAEHDVVLENGKTYALIGALLPYQSSAPRALFVMRDISLARRNEALRREFVAGVSHELKTPITSIKMAAETLVDEDEISADARRFCAIIERESDRMNSLVNDMLLLSKIEYSKNFKAEEHEEFFVKNLISETLTLHENSINAAGDYAETFCDDNLKLKGDFKLLQLALSNLIGNAIKYGGTNIKITISAEHIENGKTRLQVSDNGTGISAEDLPRVFERFYRADKGRSRALGGTGLGLAIVKHIAILHGGTATAKSDLGKGSEFSITI